MTNRARTGRRSQNVECQMTFNELHRLDADDGKH